MIYLDTSVLLAHLFAEDRCPAPALWQHPLVASRLLQYEAWTRVHARGLTHSHGDLLRTVLDRVAFIEMVPLVLARALEPFPGPGMIRTLDALHLSSLEFLRSRGHDVTLASYDDRLCAMATSLGIELFDVDVPNQPETR